MGIKSIIFVLFISMVAYHIFNVVQWMKFNEAVFNHEPGPCKTVKIRDPNCANALENENDCEVWTNRGECQANPTWMAEKCAKSCGQCEDPSQTLFGSEDFADLGDGKYLIASGLQFTDNHFPDRKRGIYMFDFNKPNDGVILLTMIWDEEKIQELNPHGIGVLKTPTGKVIVFLINHHEDDSIERFEYSAKNNILTHIETITDIQFISLNSIVPTGERSFYATNLAHFTADPLMSIEFLLMLRFGNIIHYDGESTKVVASRFSMANGLATSIDNKYLYLAHSGDMTLETFKVLDDNELEHANTIEINSVPLGIQVDPISGDIWAGVVPEPWKGVIYAKTPYNRNLTASSRVIWVKTEDGIPTDIIKDVYTNIGDAVKLASVAVSYDEQLLVGSAYDKAVYCKILHM